MGNTTNKQLFFSQFRSMAEKDKKQYLLRSSVDEILEMMWRQHITWYSSQEYKDACTTNNAGRACISIKEVQDD